MLYGFYVAQTVGMDWPSIGLKARSLSKREGAAKTGQIWAIFC